MDHGKGAGEGKLGEKGGGALFYYWQYNDILMQMKFTHVGYIQTREQFRALKSVFNDFLRNILA